MIVTLMLLWGLAQPSHIPVQTGCPVADSQTRAVVDRFQAHSAYASDRVAVGTGSVTADQIRVLNSWVDAAACKRFVGIFGASDSNPRWRWSAYRVGTRYFVAFRYVDQPGKQRLGYKPLFIYDSGFNQVGAFAI